MMMMMMMQLARLHQARSQSQLSNSFVYPSSSSRRFSSFPRSFVFVLVSFKIYTIRAQWAVFCYSFKFFCEVRHKSFLLRRSNAKGNGKETPATFFGFFPENVGEYVCYMDGWMDICNGEEARSGLPFLLCPAEAAATVEGRRYTRIYGTSSLRRCRGILFLTFCFWLDIYCAGFALMALPRHSKVSKLQIFELWFNCKVSLFLGLFSLCFLEA